MLANLKNPNNAAEVTETFLAENHDDPTARWVAGRVLTAWGKGIAGQTCSACSSG